MSKPSKDVFLSHANADKEQYVRPFAEALARKGISCWLDEAEIRWGDKISAAIDEGLRNSRFVIVFLTPAFLGRNWPEAELYSALNRENSEGRTVVLPILAQDSVAVFERYPLLRDKSYQLWRDDIEAIVSEFRNLLFISETKPAITIPVEGTPHRVQIHPDLLLGLLSDLDTHGMYAPSVLAEELQTCGFLAESFDDDSRLLLNGRFIEPTEPDGLGWGESGIWSLRLATDVFELITGRKPSLKSSGRGSAYRELLGLLRDALAERTAPV